MRNNWVLGLSGAAVVLSLVVLSALRPELGEAVNATGTMIAGVAAAYAARQSASAARDTRLALALHYQPTASVWPAYSPEGISEGQPPRVQVSIGITQAGRPASVRDVVVRWTSPGGAHSRAIPATGEAITLTGATALEGSNAMYLVTDVSSFEITCVDEITGTRWLGRHSSRNPDDVGERFTSGNPFSWTPVTS